MAESRTCSKCQENPAGDGGALPAACVAALEESFEGYWEKHAPGGGRAG